MTPQEFQQRLTQAAAAAQMADPTWFWERLAAPGQPDEMARTAAWGGIGRIRLMREEPLVVSAHLPTDETFYGRIFSTQMLRGLPDFRQSPDPVKAAIEHLLAYTAQHHSR